MSETSSADREFSIFKKAWGCLAVVAVLGFSASIVLAIQATGPNRGPTSPAQAQAENAQGAALQLFQTVNSGAVPEEIYCYCGPNQSWCNEGFCRCRYEELVPSGAHRTHYACCSSKPENTNEGCHP